MKILILCTTDSMIWNFLIPHIKNLMGGGKNIECACAKTGFYFNELKQILGVQMYEIGFERSPYNFNNIHAYFQLKQLVKQNKYDIIFCHEPVGGAMGRIVGHFCKVKVFYMAHGFHFYKGAPKSSKIYYYIEKLLSRWTDTLITINQEDYDASLSFDAKHNVKVPGIGVDISKFKYAPCKDYIRKEFNLVDNDVAILSVGELIKRKNHTTVIDAMSYLDERFHYFIAGEGPEQHNLEEQVKKLRLEKRVHFLGFRKDINKLCNSVNVFVMPSLQEGLSVALMEAMACGKPIVASRIRGNTDLIIEELGGYLVSTCVAKEYADKILKISEDTGLSNNMSSFNINHVRNFDLSTVASYLQKLFQ